jgi:hypothetical protein
VPDAANEVPLSEFVAALRSELREAQKDADESFPIEIGPVTVEFTLLTRKEGEGKAGFKFWVVEAGVTGKLATESTQRVTLELQPLDKRTGGKARVRDLEPRQ